MQARSRRWGLVGTQLVDVALVGELVATLLRVAPVPHDELQALAVATLQVHAERLDLGERHAGGVGAALQFTPAAVHVAPLLGDGLGGADARPGNVAAAAGELICRLLGQGGPAEGVKDAVHRRNLVAREALGHQILGLRLGQLAALVLARARAVNGGHGRARRGKW